MNSEGNILWTELNTWDVEKSKEYYGNLLGWTFTTEPMVDGADYTICLKEGAPVAGMFQLTLPDCEGAGNMWLTYFAVDDLDRKVEMVAEMGGEIVRQPFDVPGVGRIAIVCDPSGADHAMMKPEPQQEI